MPRPLQISRNIPSSDNPENLLAGLTTMRDEHHANAISTAHRHREHLCNLCECYRARHEPKRFRDMSVHWEQLGKRRERRLVVNADNLFTV